MITPPLSISNNISGSLLQTQWFKRYQFSFIPQDCNKAVHGLAQHAKGLSDFSAWIEEIQCIFKNFVSQDLLFLPSSE